jgi:hypothetical protein
MKPKYCSLLDIYPKTLQINKKSYHSSFPPNPILDSFVSSIFYRILLFFPLVLAHFQNI